MKYSEMFIGKTKKDRERESARFIQFNLGYTRYIKEDTQKHFVIGEGDTFQTTIQEVDISDRVEKLIQNEIIDKYILKKRKHREYSDNVDNHIVKLYRNYHYVTMNIRNINMKNNIPQLYDNSKMNVIYLVGENKGLRRVLGIDNAIKTIEHIKAEVELKRDNGEDIIKEYYIIIPEWTEIPIYEERPRSYKGTVRRYKLPEKPILHTEQEYKKRVYREMYDKIYQVDNNETKQYTGKYLIPESVFGEINYRATYLDLMDVVVYGNNTVKVIKEVPGNEEGNILFQAMKELEDIGEVDLQLKPDIRTESKYGMKLYRTLREDNRKYNRNRRTQIW